MTTRKQTVRRGKAAKTGRLAGPRRAGAGKASPVSASRAKSASKSTRNGSGKSGGGTASTKAAGARKAKAAGSGKSAKTAVKKTAAKTAAAGRKRAVKKGSVKKAASRAAAPKKKAGRLVKSKATRTSNAPPKAKGAVAKRGAAGKAVGKAVAKRGSVVGGVSRVKSRVSVSKGNTGRVTGNSKPSHRGDDVGGSEARPPKPVVKTRLTSKQLAEFKRTLLAKRQMLTGDVNTLAADTLRRDAGGELSNMPIHMADIGSDNWEQDFTLGLIESEQQLVREIDAALRRIKDGTYGVCMATGKPISVARLRAKPWAKYCIEYARQQENLRR